MNFQLRVSSPFPETDRAIDIQIKGITRETIKLSLESSFASLEPLAYQVSDFPLGLEITAHFRNIERKVTTRAKVHKAKGLDIVQIQPTYLLANLIHGRVGLGDGQCTVICETTGESRTGRNVCLECPSGAGVIKICC